MADKIKEQLKETTKILDPYGNQIGFIKKIAEQTEVNTGLILSGVLFTGGMILMLTQGW